MRKILGRILRIARRDYVAAVFTKGFFIGLILAPLMMCCGLIVIPLMKHVEVAARRIVVIDDTGSLREALARAADSHNGTPPAKPKSGPSMHLEFRDAPATDADRLRLADEVRAGKLHAFLEIGPGVLEPAANPDTSWMRYYARGSALDEARGWLDRTLNSELRSRRLAAAGLDAKLLATLTASVRVDGMTLPERDQATGAVRKSERHNEGVSMAVSAVVALVTMILVMIGSAPLLQGVLEEKSQRISEVLLGCAAPWEIMTGKLVGGIGVTLTAMAFYAGTGGVAAGWLPFLGLVPWGLIPWLVIFVASAVLMYGAIALALGSACSDLKDAQHLQLPMMMPFMVPVFLGLPVLRDPNGPFAVVASLIPPFTPLLMVLRMSVPGGVPAWQPWLGLILVLITTAFVLWLAGRIFRVGILMQGKLPKLTEILRWGIRG